MKSTFKKFGALVLVVVMMLSLSVVAFAADTAGDVYTDDSQTAISGNNIPLKKSIIFFNQNGSSVYEPNITYTYTVTPGTVPTNGATVTDDGEFNTNNPVTVRVNNGVADGVTGGTIVFSAANDAVANVISTGTEVEKSVNLSVDLSKFDHAGIYRYLVTETPNPTDVSTVGMEARTSEYNATRYLDVYIKNGTSGLELFGAVFFKTDAKDSSNTPATTAITTTTEKTTGFEPSTPGSGSGTINYTNDKTVDRYTTYDIEVKKAITGSLADKTHNFPFYIQLTNTITNAKYTYVNDPGTGTGAAETIAADAITKGTDAKTSALALKDGESVKFIGVPSNQTNALSIAVKEFNDTIDFYSASVAVVNGTAPAVTMDGNASATQMAAESGYAVVAAFDVKANDAAAQILTVTNNLTEISPTGVTLRVAPYVLMLGAGLFLVLFTRRRKEENEA